MLWKCADVIALPKSKLVSIDSLRPISLISTPAKILEKVVLHYAKATFLSKYDDLQFGFQPKSSTVCALIYSTDYITKYLDNTDIQAVEMIAYDFSRAFDKINHDLLLSRLRDLQIPHDLFYWLRDYLHSRNQRVRIGSYFSEISSIASGVPQGSLLDPYLFCIFASTLVASQDNKIVKFADDSALLCPVYNKDNNRTSVHNEHNKVLEWATQNKMPLNLNKCNMVTFTYRASYISTNIPNIASKDSIKYLWNHH